MLFPRAAFSHGSVSLRLRGGTVWTPSFRETRRSLNAPPLCCRHRHARRDRLGLAAATGNDGPRREVVRGPDGYPDPVGDVAPVNLDQVERESSPAVWG